MVKHVLHSFGDLDRVFGALADPTRRVIVERLARGPASVTELARPLAMSLPAVMQHLGVLEGCRLVTSEKVGRVRTCSLVPDALGPASDWLAASRTAREKQLDALGEVLAERLTTEEERP